MKKAFVVGLLVLTALLLIGVIVNQIPSEEDIYAVEMKNNQGDVIGTINLTETRAGVLMDVDIVGLTSDGEHAFHVHEKADCSPVETFTNAGGHYNPFDNAHGLNHPEGHHAGDMPNLKPDSKGVLKANVLNRSVTLGAQSSKDGRAPLFDNDGSSLVIHAHEDDHMSQPSGAAGSRIMCGEINQ